MIGEDNNMPDKDIEIWNLWYPKAAAAGLPFARCRIDPHQEVLVHAAPEYLTVEIIDSEGKVVAKGIDLKATRDSPMTRLTRNGAEIKRQDIWPTTEDLGNLVLLPGGEAGVLKKWEHAEDHSEWRWLIEFYNSKG
jgi:hypothetical protein